MGGKDIFITVSGAYTKSVSLEGKEDLNEFAHCQVLFRVQYLRPGPAHGATEGAEPWPGGQSRGWGGRQAVSIIFYLSSVLDWVTIFIFF